MSEQKPLSMWQRLLAFQSEVGAISKDSSNPFFNSQYFDINKLLKTVKPLLSKHGLVLLQPLNYYTCPITGKASPMLRTILANADNSDDMMVFDTLLPWLDDPQKQAGVITYFRRYALVSLLSLEAEDDDGNAASGKPASKKKASSQASKGKGSGFPDW